MQKGDVHLKKKPEHQSEHWSVRRIGTPKRVLKNANQKYRKAVLLSTRLATLISECGEEECSDRMDNLKSLVELWEAGKKTAIVEVVQEQRHIQAAAAILAEETSTPAIETVVFILNDEHIMYKHRIDDTSGCLTLIESEGLGIL